MLRNLSGSQADHARKEITAHFKSLGLRITISTNLKTVNFQDLTLTLDTCKYSPYRKPIHTPMYIHQQSNHPPTIIKFLTSAIKRRLTDISYDEEVFNAAAYAYNDALKASGYSKTITYAKQQKPTQAAQRKRRAHDRRITWYNPLYNKNVKTKIGEKFLRLVTNISQEAASSTKSSIGAQ